MSKRTQCSTRRRRVSLHAKGLLVAIIGACLIAVPHAGVPQNLLDDNRGDLALAALETAAFNTAINGAGFNLNPLTANNPPVFVSGRVLAHPKIHNLYLDDDWDGHNPDAPKMAQLDGFTQALAGSHYLDEAAQYGVQNADFTGSHGRSIFCIPVQPELDHAEFVELLAWVTCEVGFNPVPPAGLLPPITGVPPTNDDTLYVVYLPRSMSIVDGDCGSLSGYHFFGAAPNVTFESVFGVPLPIPVFYSQTFAYAVIPTKCAQGGTPQAIMDSITAAASHEIVEAATDPLVGTGWINDSVVDDPHGDFFSNLINGFSNVSTDLKVGETADICEDVTNPQTGPPAFQHPTPPINLPVDDSTLAQQIGNNQIQVATYWSNRGNGCGPFLPTTRLKFGSPNYPGGGGTYVTSSTQLSIEANDGYNAPNGPGVASVSYRYYLQGTPTATQPPFTTQAPPVQFTLSGPDGVYVVETSAKGNDGLVEAPHSSIVILDNTPPAISIVAPAATPYAHSDMLTLNYFVGDGPGSGVASTTTSLDGSTTVGGHGLASGQAINLLTEMQLGPHSFTVEGVDNLANDGSSTVSFTIVVTADSISKDVNLFLAAGLIKNSGLANSLLGKLSAAAAARARGECATASNIYSAFIQELQAQSGKGVAASAAAIMVADAQYLIANCP